MQGITEGSDRHGDSGEAVSGADDTHETQPSAADTQAELRAAHARTTLPVEFVLEEDAPVTSDVAVDQGDEAPPPVERHDALAELESKLSDTQNETQEDPAPEVVEDVHEVETFDAVLLQQTVNDERIEILQEKIYKELGDASNAYEEASEQLEISQVNEPLSETRMKLLDILPQAIGQELFDRVEADVREIIPLMGEGDRLAERAQELAGKELVALREELAQTVDWDAVIATCLDPSPSAQPPYHESSYSLWSIMAGNTPPNLDIGALSSARKWKEGFQERGQLLAKGEDLSERKIPKSQEQWLPDNNLLGATKKWDNLTSKTVFNFLSKGRRDALNSSVIGAVVQFPKLAIPFRQLGLDGSEGKDTPQQIADAFKRHVATIFEEVDQKDEEAMEALIAQGPLHVEGSEFATRDLGIADPHEWIKQRLHTYPDGFPPELVRGMTKVRFTEPIGDFAEKGPLGSRTKTAGKYSTKEEGIIISTDPLLAEEREEYERGGYHELAKILMVLESTKEAAQVLDHEVTHYAHRNTLPLRWLREWRDIAMQEEVHVTDYVSLKHKEEPLAAAAEDLADSVALYKKSPETLLAAGAFRRLDKINDIFYFYHPDRMRQLVEYAQAHQPKNNEEKAQLERDLRGALKVRGT